MYPAALQDVLSANLYLIDPPPNAGTQKYSPEQVIIAGDSAGGNLASALLFWIRDSPQRLPMPAGMILISPWLDATHSCPSFTTNGSHDYVPVRMNDPRYVNEHRKHFVLPNNDMLLDPRISTILENENPLRPLPPILIHISDCERVRDESLVFQSRLKGSPIFIEMYEDMPHDFHLFASVAFLPIYGIDRIGKFCQSVFEQNEWKEERLLWIRNSGRPEKVALTRPMAILEEGRKLVDSGMRTEKIFISSSFSRLVKRNSKRKTPSLRNRSVRS